MIMTDGVVTTTSADINKTYSIAHCSEFSQLLSLVHTRHKLECVFQRPAFPKRSRWGKLVGV